jgi:glyoxylase-like metal-dependent hydrolase (beta-lactamase superfamily II)/rhodanese-related sulfurtransferase
MTISKKPDARMTPAELAERLAAGEPLTVLDIRREARDTIEAPTARPMRRPAADVLADPPATAALLVGPVAVVCDRGMSARPVADALAALGVDALVLDGGIRGWLGALQPHPVELGVPGLEVRQIQRPGRGCLSYLLAAEGDALVVDPAPDAQFYVALAAELGARVTAIVDTHLHADHLSGARALAEVTGSRLLLPAPALDRGVTYAVTPLRDGDTLTLRDIRLRAVGLPGHTTDMTGLLVAGRALIAGDSLFADGIARPDLQKGDPDGARAMGRLLHATIHERILTLRDDVLLLPGHTHPGVHATAIAPTLGDVRRAVAELSLTDPDAFAAALLADMPPRPANYESVIAVNAGTHPFDPDLEAGGNSCSTR